MEKQLTHWDKASNKTNSKAVSFREVKVALALLLAPMFAGLAMKSADVLQRDLYAAFAIVALALMIRWLSVPANEIKDESPF